MGDMAHIDTIFKFLPHTHQHVFLVINVCNHTEHYETPCIHGSCPQMVWLLSKHVFWLYICISIFLQYLHILAETTLCPHSTVTKLICLHSCTENLRRGCSLQNTKKSHGSKSRNKVDIPTVVIACSQESVLLKLMSQSFIGYKIYLLLFSLSSNYYSLQKLTVLPCKC
jgi:hypothetical protein